jgi:hypothetical protein
MTVRLADVVHAADIRVRDLARRADFVVELRQTHRVVAKRDGQELQRHRLAEAEVVGAVDLAHPTLPQQPDDPVAPVEDRARLKQPMVDRTGRAEPAGRG